ncbi:MAG: glycosyltransferase [Lachnospiraceae bacterium]|nr:glycosyltransferase [Lachnospiraceae bacterium]
MLRICFVSNYINHHQIPFCNAMCKETEGNFYFIQTQPMEAERVRMGWHEENRPDYVHCYYEEEEWCRQQIRDCDVVLFGGCDEESYIAERLQSGKLIIRISERLYKTGQWKAISPRGLIKKYHDHTRYRKAPVYLLCAGGYVASDFQIVQAYPKKKYCWGYFPETRHYDVQQLLDQKGYECEGERLPYLLWAARFIDWKHPELPLETAHYLKQKGYRFHMDIIGGGAMEEEVKKLLATYQLEDCVYLTGYKTPEEVRAYMEKANIYLFTSDRQEGWGAVANEAMNSGCAVVADRMIGAAPYLIQNGYNGYIYDDRQKEEIFRLTERLLADNELCRQMGERAYRTITEVWNAENAAHNLMSLIAGLTAGEETDTVDSHKLQEENRQGGNALYPCAPAPIISERRKSK